MPTIPDTASVSGLLCRLLGVAAWSCAASTALFSAGMLLAGRRFRRRRVSPPPPGWAPPITVFKPIKGTDHEMEENLASFLRQDYPAFQVLFCLHSAEDPALPLLRRLRDRFPHADVDIVISKNRIGYNPKVNNLSNAYGFAKHDILIISDSDVRVPPDFLRRVAAPLADPSVGMVTCFYRSGAARGLGARLEALSVNAQFLPQALVAAFLCGMRFAMGAVMVVRRSTFEATGGLLALSEHLADDFILGRAIASAGFRLEFSDVLVESIPDASSVPQQFAHQVRWSRTIRVCNTAGYLGTLSLQGGPLLLAYSIAAGSWPAFAAFAALEAWRMMALAWLHRRCLGQPRPASELLLVAASDLLQFGAWLAGLRSSAVLWRGEAYSVTAGGRLVPKRRRERALRATAA